jgi:serine/threonine-protein kinase
MSAAKKAGGGAARTWLVRGLIALVLGSALGAGAGVFTVNKLEPGRGSGVDSLQVMLDSIAKGRIAADSGVRTPAAPASSKPDTQAAAVDSVPVPSVVDLEEGAARAAIRDAGLLVGDVTFQSNAKAAGTVLASTPAAGTFVARGTAILLTLSDGRPPTDTFPSSFSPARP